MSNETIESILKTYLPVEGKPGYIWFSKVNNTIVKESILKGAYEDFFNNKAGAIGDKEYEDNDERTIFYSRGVLETVKKLRWKPDIIHCHGCITSLIPLYLKKTYCDEPSYMEASIVYSLYDKEFTQPFRDNFKAKMMLKGVAQEDLDIMADPVDFIQVSKLAIDHADAIVQQTANVDPELIEYAKQSGKPFLPYQDNDMLQATSDFYDIIREGKERE